MEGVLECALATSACSPQKHTPWERPQFEKTEAESPSDGSVQCVIAFHGVRIEEIHPMTGCAHFTGLGRTLNKALGGELRLIAKLPARDQHEKLASKWETIASQIWAHDVRHPLTDDEWSAVQIDPDDWYCTH